MAQRRFRTAGSMMGPRSTCLKNCFFAPIAAGIERFWLGGFSEKSGIIDRARALIVYTGIVRIIPTNECVRCIDVEGTAQSRLLVLYGPSLESGGVLDFLQGHFDVRRARNLDEALDVMRREHIDAVLAETADFLPLERGVVTQHAAVVLDTLGDGVGVVGAKGELVWANRHLRELPESVIRSFRSQCAKAYENFATSSRNSHQRGSRFSLMPDNGRYYEVMCSPVRDRTGVLQQVAAVMVDATGQRRQQLKLNAIDRAGHELVRLDYAAIGRKDASERLQLLSERIISCSKEVLNYEHFAVLILDEKTNRLEMVIDEGLTEQAGRHELFATIEGNGICGYVAATGNSYICPNVREDTLYLPGMNGARSSLTVPLRLQDKVIGVLNIESSLASAFGEEDRQFAEIFANYAALALHVLNLLVFERHTTHTQVSGSICAELTGPLEDTVARISDVMEDYIGYDDLRTRLGAILDGVSSLRRTVNQAMHAGEAGVFPSPCGPVEKDPILSGKRVLVVDDESMIRQAVQDVLTPHGCMVDVAADGSQAKTMIVENQYDLVISDIKMPGADGYEVFAAAKAASSETEVILITAFGYDPAHSIVRANREGLSAVLMKPFKVKQLLDECRKALCPTT